MKKIAEFKQNHFILISDENIVGDFTKPTTCKLYKTAEGFLLETNIHKAEAKVYKKYKEAYEAFTKFVLNNLSNE